jgi:mycothiol S-conjugate amidase
VTTRVPCAEYFPVRDRALLAHATQIDPDGHWFACPLRVHQAAWPTEDYELVQSRVPTELPESDLFAGIPGDEQGRARRSGPERAHERQEEVVA